ncbi:MAG: methylenetetrahydrofolate reductase, partial [Bdellovibrionaceae bacterium]|nr:methylenetetrahydrofolate reductase [Pseudobdellovibrionaceae bacterium]
MKVIEHIQKTRGPLFSFEIIPPPRGRSVRDVIEMVEKIAPLEPPWIDVTSHSSAAYYHEKADGTIQKRIYRKRPGTIGICGIIQNRFKIDTVAHILCLGFTREETEDALIELHYLGIENVLALRGDSPNYQKEVARNRSVNNYAIDLVRQLVDLRHGKFLEDISESAPLNFGIGVAGYPEKHFEAANVKTDLMHLKAKVEAGADYIVTQMFFDNQKYFDFVGQCREIGIQVPIIPGIKMLRTVGQLKSLPKTFHIDIPEALVDEVMASPQHVEEIGFQWAFRQSMELLEKGV